MRSPLQIDPAGTGTPATHRRSKRNRLQSLEQSRLVHGVMVWQCVHLLKECHAMWIAHPHKLAPGPLGVYRRQRGHVAEPILLRHPFGTDCRWAENRLPQGQPKASDLFVNRRLHLSNHR